MIRIEYISFLNKKLLFVNLLLHSKKTVKEFSKYHLALYAVAKKIIPLEGSIPIHGRLIHA